MYFLIEDNDLIDKRNTILDKISDFKKEFIESLSVIKSI